MFDTLKLLMHSDVKRGQGTDCPRSSDLKRPSKLMKGFFRIGVVSFSLALSFMLLCGDGVVSHQVNSLSCYQLITSLGPPKLF